MKTILAPIPVLSEDKTECTIGETLLRVQQSIDFVSAVSQQAGMGRIFEFKYAGWDQQDKESVWMNVADAETGKKEWISVTVWSTNFVSKPEIKKPDKTTKRGSKKPKDTDLPF